MTRKKLKYCHAGFCLQCGRILDPALGRADRKFCSPACKNEYWNLQKNPRHKAFMKRILSILNRNYDILHRLLQMGVTSIDRITLAQLGFNLQYVTHYQRLGSRQFYGCFDIQFELTPTRIWHIVCVTTEALAE